MAWINEFLFKPKEEFEIQILVDTCSYEVINLTNYEKPPIFELMKSDITKADKAKAHEIGSILCRQVLQLLSHIIQINSENCCQQCYRTSHTMQKISVILFFCSLLILSCTFLEQKDFVLRKTLINKSDETIFYDIYQTGG